MTASKSADWQPKGSRLPFEQWPEADRRAWEAACKPPMRLKRGGAASHLKPVTRDDHAERYGRFVGFLDQQGLLRRDGPPAANVTPENIQAYIEHRKRCVSPMTLHADIGRVRRTAKYMDPLLDLSWLVEIDKDLALEAQPRSKFGRIVFSEVLVEAGLTLFRAAEISRTMTALARAHQVRDGLMVALLAFCPIRRKNFAALELGRSFVQIGERWWIVLSASETKERRADERPINDLLTPLIDRYLDHYRPILARSTHPPSALWLSAKTGLPITDKQLATEIRNTTRATVGMAIGPHLFRTCDASTAAAHAGENPNLASALLNHTGLDVINAHYNRATSTTAADKFGQIVRQYAKHSP